MEFSRGRYYLGRLVKAGLLDQSKVILALSEPVSLRIGKYGWTINNFEKVILNNGDSFYFGYLTKFSPEGVINKIDLRNHVVIDRLEPDMIIASSPFVYIPKVSGIAFLHIWNHIEEDTFVNRFTRLIIEKYDGFFVDCDVEPITDLRKFYIKISSLDTIERISAKVVPPNPLFGIHWESLLRYLRERKISELKVDEKASLGGEINTQITEIIKQMIDKVEIDKALLKETPIGDAAILMSADGYGNAKVIGSVDGKTVVVNTKDSRISIIFEKKPEPLKLYDAVFNIFDEINKERYLKH